jgi:hypothetical protein
MYPLYGYVFKGTHNILGKALDTALGQEYITLRLGLVTTTSRFGERLTGRLWVVVASNSPGPAVK